MLGGGERGGYQGGRGGFGGDRGGRGGGFGGGGGGIILFLFKISTYFNI